jgi:uncharacterized protein
MRSLRSCRPCSIERRLLERASDFRKLCYRFATATKAQGNPILKRLRDAVSEIYGDRVAFSSRARGDSAADSDYGVAVLPRDTPGRFAEMKRLADLSTNFLDETGEFIHAMPYRADAYNKRTPVMHEIRTDGTDLRSRRPAPFLVSRGGFSAGLIQCWESG